MNKALYFGALGLFWLGLHTNPAKRDRRQRLRAIGRRQLLKLLKRLKRLNVARQTGGE